MGEKFIKEKYIYWSDSHINLQDWYRKEFPHIKKNLKYQNIISLFPVILVNDELHVIELL